jgi:hypothetical protein
MQTSLIRFLAIRWSILIVLVVILSRHNFVGTGSSLTHWFEETKNGFADPGEMWPNLVRIWHFGHLPAGLRWQPSS